MAQSRLAEWSDSGQCRERLIWHEKWTGKPVVRRRSYVVSNTYDGRHTTYDENLLAVQLHNQLLIHRQLNVFALGQCEHFTAIVVAIDLQPRGRIPVCGKLLRLLQHSELAAGFPD